MALTSEAHDDIVLRAVVAFLDEVDVDGQVLPEVETLKVRKRSQMGASTSLPTVSLTGAVAQVPSLRMINRSRLRRRHELVSLREQVVALQEILERLQKGKKSKRPATRRSSAREVRVEAWRAIAECQLEQLQEAERERDNLRLLVRKRKTVIRQIERFLNQRVLHEPRHGLLKLPIQISVNSPVSLAGFEDFSRYLSSMSLQVAHIFEDPRFETMINRLHDSKFVEGYENNFAEELLGSTMLPFDVKNVAETVWKFHFIKAQKVAVDAEESLEEKGNVLRRTLGATMKLSSMSGDVSGRMETRRIVEQDRVIIIQYALFDKVKVAGTTDVGGFSVRQFWWTLIRRPLQPKFRGLRQPLCQVDSYALSIPLFDDDKSIQQRELIRDFCVEAPDTTLSNEHQAVENLLLRNASSNLLGCSTNNGAQPGFSHDNI